MAWFDNARCPGDHESKQLETLRLVAFGIVLVVRFSSLLILPLFKATQCRLNCSCEVFRWELNAVPFTDFFENSEQSRGLLRIQLGDTCNYVLHQLGVKVWFPFIIKPGVSPERLDVEFKQSRILDIWSEKLSSLSLEINAEQIQSSHQIDAKFFRNLTNSG